MSPPSWISVCDAECECVSGPPDDRAEGVGGGASAAEGEGVECACVVCGGIEERDGDFRRGFAGIALQKHGLAHIEKCGPHGDIWVFAAGRGVSTVSTTGGATLHVSTLDEYTFSGAPIQAKAIGCSDLTTKQATTSRLFPRTTTLTGFMVLHFPSVPRLVFRSNRSSLRISAPRFYAVNSQESSDSRGSLPPQLSPRGRPCRLISTLNPALLVSSDYIDLSHLSRKIIGFPKSRRDTLAEFRYEQTRNGVCIPFPPQTAGFLYYYRDRGAAPLEGGVRFRVTSNNTPSSFHRGHDLPSPSGIPWEINLPQIAGRSSYSRIRDQLLKENIVTPEHLAQCHAIFGDRHIISPFTIFRLTQEFPVNFSSHIVLTVVGETLHTLKATSVFQAVKDGKAYLPWIGSGLARFEPSTRPEHTGRRVVHLRITKIVTPVSLGVEKYPGRVMKPEEGQLLTVSLHRRIPEPWAYDIDAKDTHIAAALRVLWDNSRIP
ncbi:hypothetical protein MVEN_02249000 [Mycena venus]|uniref:Uncharacterized protein n=1 Tax=Mycena venus TaxID=2733690 RepID=A0A8H6X605_9AGAR|nr:hypothetical protein MVEN_02249000 [Mycena venus]